MRIAIVNGLATSIAAIRRMLMTVPGYQVIWTAREGSEAIIKCVQDRPDLLLMDLRMPVIDGVEATRQIMKASPCAILVVTVEAERQVGKIYEAIEQGAIDAIDFPLSSQVDSSKITNDLLAKVARVGKLLKEPSAKAKESFPTHLTQFERRSGFSTAVPLVAIGSSTGGPKALAAILSQLPVNFGAAIAIVQHVDAQFSGGLIDWLNQQTALPVRSAVAGDRLQKGTVLVASTNDHLYLTPELTLGYTSDPIDYPYRPSVDVFFKSLAQHWSRKGTAILLTGMGRDGAEGLSSLRQRGWHTIAQSKESCVVYGMPKAAAELNAASEVLSPEAIALSLLQQIAAIR